MKTASLLALVLMVLAHGPKEKKLLGSWRFVKTVNIQKMGDNLYSERSSGLIDNELIVNFEPSHIAVATYGKKTDTLSWQLRDNQITIDYNGNYEFLQALKGSHSIQLDKRQLQLFNAEDNRRAYFVRVTK